MLCSVAVFSCCVLMLCCEAVFWCCVLMLCSNAVFWRCVLMLCSDAVFSCRVLMLCSDASVNSGRNTVICFISTSGESLYSTPLHLVLIFYLLYGSSCVVICGPSRHRQEQHSMCYCMQSYTMTVKAFHLISVWGFNMGSRAPLFMSVYLWIHGYILLF